MNKLTIIQMLLFSLVTIPSIYYLLREPFIHYKKYRRERITLLLIILLISIVAFMLISIYITGTDNYYMNMKYSSFNQMISVIKTVITLYIQIIALIVTAAGIIACYIFVTDKALSSNKYYVVNVNMIKDMISKFTKVDKFIKYPYFYLETVILVKYINKNNIVLSSIAYKQGQKFIKKSHINIDFQTYCAGGFYK